MTPEDTEAQSRLPLRSEAWEGAECPLALGPGGLWGLGSEPVGRSLGPDLGAWCQLG